MLFHNIKLSYQRVVRYIQWIENDVMQPKVRMQKAFILHIEFIFYFTFVTLKFTLVTCKALW